MGSPQPQTQPPKASLLGLPPELRLQMYDILIASETRHRISGRWERNVDEHLQFLLPTAHLALTCSHIANELSLHGGSLPVIERFAVLTVHDIMDKESKHSYISRAPCRLVDLTVLKIEVNLMVNQRRASQFWPQFARDAYTFMFIPDDRDFLFLLFVRLIRPSSFLGKAHALKEVQVRICLTIEETASKVGKHDDLVQKILSEAESDITKALSRDRMSARNGKRRQLLPELDIALKSFVKVT